MKLKDLWKLLRTTFSEWKEDKADRLAAAMAYYTSFSLAPILVIVLALVGLIYDRKAAQEQIITQMRGLAGSQGEELILSMLNATQGLGSNVLATIIGVVALIFGATGVFGQLQDALNTMWEVKPKPTKSIWGILRERLFSFTMVLIIGFLLLVSLIISAVLSAFQNWSMGFFPGYELIVQSANLIVSLLVITALFALLFKFVPDAEIKWRDVWLGAGVTALLFTLGKFAIGLYLGNSNVTNTFGAAGALVVILLWVYYSAQISFFGAEFTQVYANTYGSKIVPKLGAEPLTEEAREQQGLRRDKDRKEEPHGQEWHVPASMPSTAIANTGENPHINQEPERDTDLSLATLSSILGTLAGIVIGFLLKNRRKTKSNL